ncbi:MAG: hypothetical protein ACI9LO_003361 [Planctomycetota bacterium]|jgi:hypothetical protein
MKRSIIYLVIALVAGIAIGKLTSDDVAVNQSIAPTVSSNTNNLRPEPLAGNSTIGPVEIDQLRQMIQVESQARLKLEAKVRQLESRITASIDSNTAPAATTDAALPEGHPKVARSSDEEWFNLQGLLELGMNTTRAEQLKTRFETLELDRLYLRDQSVREEWSREQFREAMIALSAKEDALQSELGETDYDAYLYASGQTNRLEVASVLANSQAGGAGIKAGDRILRYDNQRIYNWPDLQSVTTDGNIDDSVELEVERDGRVVQLYVTRGPLGVRLNQRVVAP